MGLPGVSIIPPSESYLNRAKATLELLKGLKIGVRGDSRII